MTLIPRFSRLTGNPTPCGRQRREFLCQLRGGFASLALIDLLGQEGFFGSTTRASQARAPRTHFPARAKHCIFLFMNGAPSQVDTFDPKPVLAKYDGQPYQGKQKFGSNNRPVGYLMKSPFQFTPHGHSGLEISELFPHTAHHADDLCVLRAMQTDTAAHSSGCLQLNTGSPLTGKPSLGAWLSYGLGSLNENLPSYVVMTDPRGGPIGGAPNWGPGYMPAAYQGTLFRGRGSPLLDLVTPEGVGPRTQRHSLDLLADLNREHAALHPRESELAA